MLQEAGYDPAKGQVAVVTGAHLAAARRVIRELADSHCRIAALSSDSKMSAEAFVGLSLPETDRLALGVARLVPIQMEAAIADIHERLGPVSCLVTGFTEPGPGGPTWQADPAHWWQAFEASVLGATLAIAAVLPGMLERNAGIIFVLGGAGAAHPGGRTTAQEAADGALVRMAQGLELELTGTNVQVSFLGAQVSGRDSEAVPMQVGEPLDTPKVSTPPQQGQGSGSISSLQAKLGLARALGLDGRVYEVGELQILNQRLRIQIKRKGTLIATLLIEERVQGKPCYLATSHLALSVQGSTVPAEVAALLRVAAIGPLKNLRMARLLDFVGGRA